MSDFGVDWTLRLSEAIAATTRVPAPRLRSVTLEGRVVSTLGSVIRVRLPGARIGALCVLHSGGRKEFAEVVGFEGEETVIAPLGRIDGLRRGDRVSSFGRPHSMRFPVSPIGRVFDGFGRVVGRIHPGEGPSVTTDTACTDDWVGGRDYDVMGEAPDPTRRPVVSEPLPTGIRALDALATLGKGQRVGVFAGPGCGKTTLLAAIARGSQVDAVVFALIGERGRELKEFLDRSIPPELARRCVVVCATSDRPALERARAALTATTIAEALRDRGLDVLLMVDSVTRLARAQREIGIAAGEPVTRSGLTPSVFAALPRLIERAGTAPVGTITALYAVLVEGRVDDDPLASELKSLLDAHIVLSPELAQESHFPAIDPLASLSRLQSHLVDAAHSGAAAAVRRLLSRYREVEFLLRVGEYRRGADPQADAAISARPDLRTFLCQDLDEISPFEVTVDRLAALRRSHDPSGELLERSSR